MKPKLVHWIPIVVGGIGFVWMLADLLDVGEVWRAHIANPTKVQDVRVVVAKTEVAATPQAQGDFDGDGVPDRFDVEYFTMSPLSGPRTVGLLRVFSGRQDGELLVYPIPFPFDPVWIGDIDGNGTDDLRVINTPADITFLHAP